MFNRRLPGVKKQAGLVTCLFIHGWHQWRDIPNLVVVIWVLFKVFGAELGHITHIPNNIQKPVVVIDLSLLPPHIC